MNKQALLHRAKSNMAYAYDKETIHIWLQTAKNDFDKVKIIAGDPFHWGPKEDNPEVFEWKSSTADLAPMEKKYQTELFDYYFISLKPPFKRLKYAFLLEADNQDYLYGCRETYNVTSEEANKKYNLFNYFNFPFINAEDVKIPPSWINDTIWYQIFPERFSRGETKEIPNLLPWGSVKEHVKNSMVFGGDLKGIMNKLDYIKELGCNGIYFNPIFESPSTHKYDTTDYYKIDPQFGSNEDFKILVEEAHKKGIKVMLDAVFNHCGWSHPFFQDVVKNKKDSKYYECFSVRQEPMFNFEIDEKGLPVYSFKKEEKMQPPNFDTFAFTPYMPKWNTESKITRDHLLGATRYWMENYNIDGWRLDVSNEVSHDFWREFNKVVHSINKDAIILGENWDNSNPWLGADQMDCVMNYELLYPIWQFFGTTEDRPKINGRQFRDIISNLMVTYQDNTLECMFNLLGCHDTDRILHVCNEDKNLVRLPYIFIFTFTGSPSIYYGDEIGITGGGDPDNRRCMIWNEDEQDLDLKGFIMKLTKLRKEHASFRAVDIKFFDTNNDDNCILYRKIADDEITYVIINNDKKANIVSLPNEMFGTKLYDLLNNKEVIYTSSMTLLPYGYQILSKKKEN